MQRSIRLILPVLTITMLAACGGEDVSPNDAPNETVDSTDDEGAGGTSSDGGGAADNTGGGTATGGNVSSDGGSPGNGDGDGDGDSPTGGAPGTGGATDEPDCSIPSTDDYEYSGSCLQDDLCNDQYDTSFGTDVLQQACASQGGQWSTAPCDPAPWDKRCHQEVFGGLYVIYMPQDGICAIGCEEPL